MSLNSKGFLAVAASALALSTMGIFGKLTYAYGVDPLNLVTLRAIIAFTTLFVALTLIRRKLPRIARGHIALFALLGLIGISLNYASFFLALTVTSVSTAIVLVYTYPAFVMVGSVLFLGEAITGRKVLALILTLIGCFFVAEAYDIAALRLNGIGVALGLLASITKSAYTLASKRALKQYDPWTTVLFAFGFGALFLSAYTLPSGRLDLNLPQGAWLYILAIAWLPTLIGYSLFVVGLKYLEASKASIIATLEPVTAMLLSAFVLQELVAPGQFIGVAAVIAGIVVLNLRPRVTQTA